MHSAKTFVLANIHTDTFPCQETKSVTPSLYLRQSQFGYANMESCSICTKNAMAMSGQMPATSADVTKGRQHPLLYLCSTLTNAEGRNS